MDLVLMLNEKASELMEKEVIRYIIRDFYLLYAKEELVYLRAGKKKTYRFYFYCRPNDAQQIAYRIGINMQCLRPFYFKNHILLSSHRVPDPFPDSVRLDIKLVKAENIKEENVRANALK